MSRVVYVFLGGGAGSVARYLTTIAAARLISPAFPFGTLIVNLVGCFLVGFVHTVAIVSARLSIDTRLFLTAGVLGGLTTYSAFNYETLSLLDQGHARSAALYAAAMLAGCGLAGILGVWSAREILSSV
jgi:CrcB protein